MPSISGIDKSIRMMSGSVLASTGAEALQQAEKTEPDIILMDLSMPDMDGIEAGWYAFAPALRAGMTCSWSE
jgi:CheY-like chemotaxis protein